LLIILVLFSRVIGAQDERIFRSIYESKLEKFSKKLPVFEKGFLEKFSDAYEIDINRDGFPESFLLEKSDGIDRLHIFTAFGKRIFSYEFENKGLKSGLYKIQMRPLSNATTIVILYYYEGYTEYFGLKASSRVYFMTVDNKDLTTLQLFKGPSFWDEERTLYGHYHQKNYHIGLKDYDEDGIKEVVLKFNDAIRVYKYLGSGKWKDNYSQKRSIF